MTVIINYGCGNLSSIYNMVRRFTDDVSISSDAAEISKAERLILPGIGAFDTGRRMLEESGLLDVVNQKALVEKVPVLGICLGMQLMTKGSDEGNLPGLGWFNAKTVSFKSQPEVSFKIPLIGWKRVAIEKESRLFGNMYPDPKFYFIHSYFVKSGSPEDVLTITDANFKFVSALEKDNLYGVQFHPEKSHKFGMMIFQNFLKI